MTAVVTVNDVLDGHVGLDVECLDRIYLNGYVPNLQVAGQVVSFMTAHLGNPIPSPAILEKIGIAFRKAVDRFAADNKLPVVRLGKDDREVKVMRPYLARQARTGRCGVAAIGIAQEFRNVFASTQRKRNPVPWFSFFKADRRVTCFYGASPNRGGRSTQTIADHPNATSRNSAVDGGEKFLTRPRVPDLVSSVTRRARSPRPDSK